MEKFGQTIPPQEKVEREPVSDGAVFQALGKLEIVRGSMTPEDRDWFTKVYFGLRTAKERDEVFANTENRKRLVDLQEKYKDAKTGVYEKVEIDPESLSAAFGTNKFGGDIAVMRALGVEEVHRFENKVGNWKPVPLLSIQGKQFVLKKVAPEYFAEYAKVQQTEHRPEVREVVVEGNHYGLFEFKGDEVMDFTDKRHLEQLCEIGIASAKRLTTFDPNQGNLLVENDRLYYIDVGLQYTRERTPAEAAISNLFNVVQNIPEVMEKTVFLETILFCIEEFKKRIAPIPLVENESAEEIIKNEMAPLLKYGEALTPEVDQKIRDALSGLFASK